MTDQEEDLKKKGGKVKEGTANVKQVAGNITNIINNNNINNYIINDTTKGTPTQFIMQQQQNNPRISTAPASLSTQPSGPSTPGMQRPSEFAVRQMYKPPSAGQ